MTDETAVLDTARRARVAATDLAVARLLLDRAAEAGLGTLLRYR